MKLLATFAALLFTFPSLPAAQQPSLSAAQEPQRDPQALALLNQALTISGGASALAGIQDLTATGNITYYWAGEEVQGGVTVKGRGTDEFRLDANLPSGTRSWTASPFEASVKDTDGSVVAIPPVNARNLGATSFPQLKIASALNNSLFSIQYGGLANLGERRVHLIHVQQAFSKLDDPDGFLSHLTATDVFIDSTTYLVVLIRDTIHPPNHIKEDLSHEIEFSDYRLANNYFVPFSITESINGQRTWTIQLSAISFNTGLTDADFKL